MKIHFAADHAGYELKNVLLSFVRDDLGYEVIDYGAFSLDADDDYPLIISAATEAVAESKDTLGIVLGGSGQGEAIAANRVRGIRAALYYGGPLEIISLSREHNDANVLSLGARFLSEEEAKAAVKLWLETPFSNEERHIRRISQLS